MAPLTGKPAPKEAIQESWDLIHKSLGSIERYWMIQAEKSGFMFGTKPTIADLSLACELA